MYSNICVLGSTGSIGTQTLEVVDDLEGIKVWGLTANKNIDLLEKQIRKYKPKLVAVMDKKAASELKKRISDMGTKVDVGLEGLIRVATIKETEIVITAIVGTIGLIPTYEAILNGKNIGLANKETLVACGEIIMNTARQHNVSIIPVDSEHSAIFQCLKGNKECKIKNIILTASGGPFRGKKKEYLATVTPEEALKHPNWNMGKKISIDSATLMNKGLEVIEAKWLFDVDIEKIKVVIHPQSIIHSMVEYTDNSIIAQLSMPSMKIPIQYAITYPRREKIRCEALDFSKVSKLTFEEPDINTFKCLKLSFDALKIRGTMPAVLNAANEVSVEMFLDKKISFVDIPEIISETMNKHNNICHPTINNILEADKWARDYVYKKG
jgi:1-deoxy-D-xylulose-5-phosphate reductoisomerase